jgi:hypothetical protein
MNHVWHVQRSWMVILDFVRDIPSPEDHYCRICLLSQLASVSTLKRPLHITAVVEIDGEVGLGDEPTSLIL